MKPQRHFLLLALLISLLLLAVACGPSEEEQAATTAAAAANAAATQTAVAPTATPEPTATPRPTDTPTPFPVPTSPPAQGIIDASTEAMAQLETFAFEMVMDMSIVAEGITMDIPLTMSGVTEPPDKSQMSMTMSMLGMNLEFEMIQIGDEFYMREPGTDAWQSVTAEEAEASTMLGGPFLNPEDFASADPQAFEELELVGTEQLDGVQTYHLRGQIAMEEVDGVSAILDVDYWIGVEDNLVRQATLSGDIGGAAIGDLGDSLSGAEASMEATMTFSAFDEPVTIEAPEVSAIEDGGDVSSVQVNGVAFSPDGASLATVDDNGTVKIFDLAGPSGPAAERPGDFFILNAVAFTPAGDLFAGGGDQLVYLWPAADLDADPLELDGHSDWIRALAASSDGRWLASAGDDMLVLVWDTADLEAGPAVLEGHTDWVRAVAFSGDNRWLASAGDDTMVLLWDLSDLTAAPVELVSHDDWVRALAASPDGSWLASGGDDRVIRLWDLADLEAEPLLLEGHEDWIKALAFSPDGSHLASAGDDATILIWDMSDLSASPLPLPGHTDYITALAFSADGRYLVSADEAGVVMLWDLSADEPSVEIVGQ